MRRLGFALEAPGVPDSLGARVLKRDRPEPARPFELETPPGTAGDSSASWILLSQVMRYPPNWVNSNDSHLVRGERLGTRVVHVAGIYHANG